MKENRKTDGDLSVERERYFRASLLAEQDISKLLFGRSYFVGSAFIASEVAN